MTPNNKQKWINWLINYIYNEGRVVVVLQDDLIVLLTI